MHLSAILLISLITFFHWTNSQADSPYIPVQGSAWRLALADINHDDHQDLIYATTDGTVYAQDLTTGKHYWDFPLDGFPFSLAAQDINHDGQAEVFAATASGTLYAISPTGQLLWTFRSPLPLYAVAVGDIAAGGPLEIATGGIDGQVSVLSGDGQLLANAEVSRFVHRLAVADVDADGIDEIFVIDVRVYANLFELNPSPSTTQATLPMQLTRHPAWQQRLLTVPPPKANWENPAAHFVAFNIAIDDINADQQPDILLGGSLWNQQAVQAMHNDGTALWISPKQPPFTFIGDTYTEFFSTALIQIAELDADAPGKEILSVAGGLVRLLNSQGEILQQANAKLGFTDLVLDGKTAYLGSSPNGDNTVYRLDLQQDWVTQLRNLTRQGHARTIGNHLATLRQQVLAYQGSPTTERRYDIRYETTKLKPQDARSAQFAQQLQGWFKQQFPYPNLRLVLMLKIMEDNPPLDSNGQPWSMRRWQVDALKGTHSVEDILAAARWIEQQQIPTVFNIGHHCTPFITLTTAERILQTAPNYAVGFRSAEDECRTRIAHYFQDYFGPLTGLCAQYGKKCTTLNKNVWWLAVPALEPVYSALFAKQRRQALVAASEDSNSRTPELNLLGRAGLWLAGLIQHVQVSVISDLFSFSRMHEWEYPKHGHPYLRLLVAHTLLGGSEFSTRIMDLQPLADGWQFSELGRESTEIFYHMLGKGLVFTPTPEQVKGFSSIGIAVHPPSTAWLTDGFNGHAPWLWEMDTALSNAVIPHNGSLWGNTETPAHALQHVLMGKQRQFGTHIPATPYGLIAFIPAHADLDKVSGIKTWWHTDGISVWQTGGKKLTGMAAAQALQHSFAEAAKQLAFRAEGHVFLQTLQLSPTQHRLFLIDPGWLDPADRAVTLHQQLAAATWQAKDVLTNQPLPVQGKQLSITIPAGSLRIVDVTLVRTSEQLPLAAE